MINEVKTLALQEYKNRREEIHAKLANMKFESAFVRVPFIVDMVVDTLVYRVKDRKFVAIEMEIDDTKSTEAINSFSRTAVYSDKTRTESLPIPEEIQ